MSEELDNIIKRIIEAIRYYASISFDIIPLTPCSKKPIKGFKWKRNRISAEEFIDKILKDKIAYNIAIRLGYYNGYGRIVIDFDYKKEDKGLDNSNDIKEYLKSGKIKARSLEEVYNLIEEPEAAKDRLDRFFAIINGSDDKLYEKIKDTMLVESGSKGYHIYILIKCSKEEFERFKNVVGKYGEIRCDKEYIVAPPSIHEKTLDSYKIVNDKPLILNLEEGEIVYNTAIEVLEGNIKKRKNDKKKRKKSNAKKVNTVSNASDRDLVDMIFNAIKRFYKQGYRYNIIKHLTGWLCNEGIDYLTTKDLVIKLIEYNNDEERDNRLLLLDRAYSNREQLTGFPSLKELLASIDENGEEIADSLMDIVKQYKGYLFEDIDSILLRIDELSMWRDIKSNTKDPRDYQRAIETIDRIKRNNYYECIVCNNNYADYNDAIDCSISHKNMLKSIKARRYYYISIFYTTIIAKKENEDIDEILESIMHDNCYICYCMKKFDDIEEWLKDMLYHIHVDKINSSNNRSIEDMLRIYEDDIEDYNSIDNLFYQVRDYIKKYVDFIDESYAILLSMFVFYCWLDIDRFPTACYLHIIGDKNSGKTRCLDTLVSILPKPLKSSSISTAAIARVMNMYKPILFIDELDSIVDNETKKEFLSILNAGYKKGDYYIRADPNSNYEVILLNAFGPKVIGGRNSLQDTLESRCIKIVMVKSKRSLSYKIDDEEAKGLRARLRKFSRDYKAYLEIKDIDISDGRLREILLPLLNSTPKGMVNDYADAIVNALTKDRSEEESEKFEAKLINTIDSILKEKGLTDDSISIKVKDITTRFMINEGYIKSEENIDFRDKSIKNLSSRIGKILKNRFGFKSGERIDNTRDRTVIIDLNIFDRLRDRYIPKEDSIRIDNIGLCMKKRYIIYKDEEEVLSINLVDDKIECYCCNRYYDINAIYNHLSNKIDLDKAYIKGDNCVHISNAICIKCFIEKVRVNVR